MVVAAGAQVREARSLLEDSEAERMFPPEQLVKEAITATEQDGIVFIDEVRRFGGEGVPGGKGLGLRCVLEAAPARQAEVLARGGKGKGGRRRCGLRYCG